MHWCTFLYLGQEGRQQNDTRSPVTPHPARDVITSFLGLHEDDGLVLFLRHDLLHQLDQPEEIISYAVNGVLDSNRISIGFIFITC